MKITMASRLCPEFCPHCSEYLSKKAFLQHRRLYYIPIEDVWVKKKRCDPTDNKLEDGIVDGDRHEDSRNDDCDYDDIYEEMSISRDEETTVLHSVCSPPSLTGFGDDSNASCDGFSIQDSNKPTSADHEPFHNKCQDICEVEEQTADSKRMSWNYYYFVVRCIYCFI